MNKIITQALDECQNKILRYPHKILSEGDFERLLANCLESSIGASKNTLDDINYIVHTQVSHYADNETKPSVDARVDILIMDENERIICEKHRKGYTYSANSYAFELKYIHKGESASLISEDFNKADKLLPKSELYVIVLLDGCDRYISEAIKKEYEKKKMSITHKDKLHYREMFKKEI